MHTIVLKILTLKDSLGIILTIDKTCTPFANKTFSLKKAVKISEAYLTHLDAVKGLSFHSTLSLYTPQWL